MAGAQVTGAAAGAQPFPQPPALPHPLPHGAAAQVATGLQHAGLAWHRDRLPWCQPASATAAIASDTLRIKPSCFIVRTPPLKIIKPNFALVEPIPLRHKIYVKSPMWQIESWVAWYDGSNELSSEN